MRGRMSDASPMPSRSRSAASWRAARSGEVVASQAARLRASATSSRAATAGSTSLRPTARACARSIPPAAPISTALGVLGMPGMTAYVGLLDIGQPQGRRDGGGLGGLRRGRPGGRADRQASRAARVVGIAGGAEKCRYVTEELGFDACIDHRGRDLAAAAGRRPARRASTSISRMSAARCCEAVFPRLNDFAPHAGVRRHRASTTRPTPGRRART